METLWLWSDRFTIVLSLIAAVFSFRAWARTTQLLKVNRDLAARRRAQITIQFASSDPKTGERDILELPYRPRRDQFSRAELTGIISFYFGRADRYDTKILQKVMEDGTLAHVLAGDLDGPEDETLTIECDPETFDNLRNSLNA